MTLWEVCLSSTCSFFIGYYFGKKEKKNYNTNFNFRNRGNQHSTPVIANELDSNAIILENDIPQNMVIAESVRIVDS